MAPRPTEPHDLLPLTPAAFHILLSLVEGERHGYAIMREVEERTGGEVRLGPGTLYGAIKRLLEQGVVEELDVRTAPEAGEERRRYYRLTGYGRRVVAAEAERLERLVQVARAKNLIPRAGPA